MSEERKQVQRATRIERDSVVFKWVVPVLLAVLVFTVNAAPWSTSNAAPPDNTVEQLGLAFLGSYLIPFEVVGVLLSVALIGAVILAREKTKAEETEL